MEEKFSLDKFSYDGIQQCMRPRDRRPPFIYMGAFNEEGKCCLAFYVDRDLKGPYWPDDEGRMIRRGNSVDFEGVPRRTIYHQLSKLASMTKTE